MNKKNSIINARVYKLDEKPCTHKHLHHQIVFGLSGHAEFRVSGIDGYIQKGVGCIVPSNHSHTFSGHRKNKILILDITQNVALLELETAFRNNAFNNILDSPTYFEFGHRMHALLDALASELSTEKTNHASSNAIGQCLLHSLYHRLSCDIEVKEAGTEKHRIDLSRIRHYIYDNLSGKIHTADLARLCHLSESYFYQKFRESTGLSPYQYVIDQRIKAASSMMLETDKLITEICFTLGFSSQSAFTTVFKKKTGMSPSEFRQQHTQLNVKQAKLQDSA